MRKWIQLHQSQTFSKYPFPNPTQSRIYFPFVFVFVFIFKCVEIRINPENKKFEEKKKI